MPAAPTEFDVVIIGGGPAGASVGSLLRLHHPELRVAILEAEKFPRDHVGESLLPGVCTILNEMGAWPKVEAQGFPIKVGATFRWGLTDELWHFNLVPGGDLPEAPRPASYDGLRRGTAFQVDRSIYDKVLLDHARELGGEVYEECRVSKVHLDGDTVCGLDVAAPEGVPIERHVKARIYVDASGPESILRKALKLDVDAPTSLRNIAIWDYWQNAEWAERIGVGGTRIQVMSLGWGWLWFIPITPTRTSIGLVTSAEYFKASGKSTRELYDQAISEESLISGLVANATCEEDLRATKDWSFVCNRLAGANWFLAGDACGFADPILSAGMTLAQVGAKRVAYSILEMLRNPADAEWLKEAYNRVQSDNIRQHIRFADYWYSANSRFTDLKEYCSTIARDAGLNLDPDEAFQWLGSGGFTSDLVGLPFSATFRFGTFKQVVRGFSGRASKWSVAENNIFERNTEGAVEGFHPLYAYGGVEKVPCLMRDGKSLPLRLIYKYVWNALGREKEILPLSEWFLYEARLDNTHLPLHQINEFCIEALEVMVMDGWVKASFQEGLPVLNAERVGALGAL